MVVREELIFAVGQVNGNQLKVLSLVFLHEPLQRHGVPKDDAIILGTDLEDSIPHVVIGINLDIDLVVQEVVVTETALMHNHTMVVQIIDITDIDALAFGYDNAVGEKLNDRLTIG